MHESHGTASQSERELARLRAEIQLLRTQLEDSQETLRAIQEGAVDALVIDTPDGQRVFTLQGGEHPYRALIEQMREGAATLTPAGVIHYCNGRFAEMLKLPLERVMGGRMEEFVAPADRAMLAAMLQEGEGRAELALTAADATEVPTLVSAISLVAEGPAAICLVVADLTERKHQEAEIHQLNRELEERVVERTAQLAAANRELEGRIAERERTEEALVQAKAAAEAANVAKSQFLASMSHELRTPMNAILGMTDLALGEQLPPTVRDYLQTAKESADLLLELLNEILDFSRIEAGRFELESTPFRLRKTVEHVIKTLGVRAYEKGLELVYQVADELPDVVVGDSLRLRQVLMNLVNNAIKFTSKGEVVLRVEAEGLGIRDWGLGKGTQPTTPDCESLIPNPQSLIPSPPNPQSPIPAVVLHFSVSDTGIGIAPEKVEQIFAPFTQADSSTSRRFGGTGLGLAISQRLVNLMGGHIRVESQPGEGSTFHFTLTLPIAEQADAEGEVTAGDQDAFRGLPAIVIGESATSRKILQQTLASWSMQVDEAPDVPTGLTKIHEAAAAGRAYRVVLADAVMPGVDGFTLVAWLAQDSRLAGSVILMLSATDRQNYPDRCRELASLCLEKPVSRSALFNAIAKAVGAEGTVRFSDINKTAGVLPVPRQILRVLLAEDTPANQKLVRHVLGSRGHNIEIAENGQQALGLVQQQDFDVVLMDVQMPEMDGFEATGAIRKLNDSKKASLPIIAMTAHALKGDQERCLAAGMDCYLSKPIKGEELIELVERLAEKEVGIGD